MFRTPNYVVAGCASRKTLTTTTKLDMLRCLKNKNVQRHVGTHRAEYTKKYGVSARDVAKSTYIGLSTVIVVA
jgi:hypothetical protein